LSKSDITGGIDTVAQIFEALETEGGALTILPELVDQPNDEADLIIWAIINYGRRLQDLPFVSYREIWDFYDEMLEEYFETKGLNEYQRNNFKQEREKIYRDLQEVYVEPIYEGVEFMDGEFDE